MSLLSYFRPASKAKLLRGERVAWIANSKRSEYLRLVTCSFPDDTCRQWLKELAAEAKRLTVTTGEVHVIDHIVPITHPRVCGLSVPQNIRVIPYRINATKSNRWNDEQLELFDIV